MKTVTIQIGNTDDKLTQSEWNSFVNSIRSALARRVEQVYFFGAPPNYERWQNVCWVVGCKDEYIPELKETVVRIRDAFKQDSVAWTEGETVFI